MMIKTADYKVTALFCVIDDFCKHFEAENAGKLLLGEVGTKRRRRKASLSDSEIIPQFGIRNLAQTFVGLHYCPRKSINNPMKVP